MNAQEHIGFNAKPLLITAVAIGSLAWAWQAIRANNMVAVERTAKEHEAELRRIAESNERLVLTQFEEQEAVLDFVQTHVLGGGWLKGELDKETTLRQAVDAAAPAIETEFAGRPLFEAAARNVFATAYQRLGEPLLAIAQLKRARELRKAALGPNHPATLSVMNNLAVAYRNAGRSEEAIQLMEETLRIKREVLGSEHPDTFLGIANLALAYHEIGRTREALSLWEEAFELQKRHLGPNHPDTLGSMGHIAVVYQLAGNHERATALMNEAIQSCRDALAKTPANTDYQERLKALLDLQAQHFGHQKKDETRVRPSNTRLDELETKEGVR